MEYLAQDDLLYYDHKLKIVSLQKKNNSIFSENKEYRIYTTVTDGNSSSVVMYFGKSVMSLTFFFIPIIIIISRRNINGFIVSIQLAKGQNLRGRT